MEIYIKLLPSPHLCTLATLQTHQYHPAEHPFRHLLTYQFHPPPPRRTVTPLRRLAHRILSAVIHDGDGFAKSAYSLLSVEVL